MSVIAVASFDPADWDELKTLCADLQGTYAEWRAAMLAGLKARNLTLDDVVEVRPEPGELRRWKVARGRKIKAKDRANLAALKLAETQRSRDETSH